ncbi:DMT family transporter [Pseudoroseicyclus tamaricis]|uniref:DMT family transporter n=1 Tax=Pseudoroseicyclus tamaricis TaxID=2705421 RepID=A0A6B2JZN6_9RHOB|nr:DMT family transporter [Pseudoroseicyclus tamaricis]NDV01724.1 DMT family transporter [Pseudoroseicyclus tamaricis]
MSRQSAPEQPTSDGAANIRGALIMVLSMALFAVEDLFIKVLAATVPPGEMLMFIGGLGAPILAGLSLARREPWPWRALAHRTVALRTAGEAVGTFGYILALSLAPLALVSAMLQAVPLAVTLGAALVFGEAVGWRRWSAVAVGFAGVVIVVDPWGAGFDPAALFAILAIFGLGARDLATRVVPRAITGLQLSVTAFVALVPTGALLMWLSGTPFVPLTGQALAFLPMILIFGIGGYLTVVAATRAGDVGFVAPFRYFRILFAMVLASTLLGEAITVPMLIGSALIVGSGLYTFFRERRLRRAASLVAPRGI